MSTIRKTKTTTKITSIIISSSFLDDMDAQYGTTTTVDEETRDEAGTSRTVRTPTDCI